MTALDDALNTSAPVFLAPTVKALWAEEPPAELTNSNPDSLADLSEQSSGALTVSQSLDDGLPSPVTMTNGNDAGTKASLSLNGREEIFGQTIAWRTGLASGNGTAATTISPTLPADSDWGDYSIVAVVVNSNTATVTEASSTLPYGWRLLSSQDDGATLKTYVYGRKWYSGGTGPVLTISTGVTYSWVAVSVSARMADGTQIPWYPGTAVSAGETVSGTAHSAPSATLSGIGYVVGVWSSVGITWAPGAGTVELNERSNTLDVSVTTTALVDAGARVLTATSGSATAVATMIAIPLVLGNRKRMDAKQFFSPFNPSSPVYGRDRDVAPTQIDFNVLGVAGAIPTTIHKGQMASISGGVQATMEAVSKTRLDMDQSLLPPKVSGPRESMTADWLATWLMSRGGQFVGPAPSRYAVYWAPFYGSVHAHLEGVSPFVVDHTSYNKIVTWDANGMGPGAPGPGTTPTVVPGPFLTGIWGEQTSTRVEEVHCDFFASSETLPHIKAAYPTRVAADQMSQANTVGRVSFWVRGDPVFDGPTFPGPLNVGFHYRLETYTAAGGSNWLGYFSLEMDAGTRRLVVTMGSTAGGFGALEFSSAGAIPTDGQWHFISCAWDMANGLAKVKIDGTDSTPSSYWTAFPVNISALPVIDAARTIMNDGGDPRANLLRSHMPIADFQVEAGQPYSDDFSIHYPNPAFPGKSAIMRTLGLSLAGLAETIPLTSWDTLVELAQASLSAYRTDEADGYNLLPLGYFGETAQMTSTSVVDTEVNAGEMDVILDPSKTRNVVTVQFSEASVSTLAVPVLTVTQGMTIPRGVSFTTFVLDVPAVEIYGEDSPGGETSGNWTIWNLQNNEINGTIPPTSVGHYMTVNTKQDGTGTNVGWDQVKGRIMSSDAGTVVIRFTNKLNTVAYLGNNGDSIPFLLIRGNSYTVNDAYVTVRDEASVTARRERPLYVQLPWVDNRADATRIAQQLVIMLARPRPQLSVNVMGDPRRKPGQLVTLADAEETQAAGTWRVLSVDHQVDGAQYTQNLALVYQLPVGLWDGAPGWDQEAWGV